MKTCSKCQIEKGTDKFPKRKGYKDGIYCWCFSCCNEYQKHVKGNDISVKNQVCNVCLIEKTAESFSKSKTRKTGLDSRCKQCYKEITRNRRGGLSPLSLERRQLKENNQFRCIKCDVILHITQKVTKDYNVCKICANRINRENYNYNPQKRREEYLANPFRYKEQRVRRRGRVKNAKGKATKKQIKERFDYYGNKCIYCGNTENLTVEHIIPLVKGGTNWPANLAPACLKCNTSKNGRTKKEWIEQGGVCPLK